MSITFLHEFVAVPDRADDLRATLHSLLPTFEQAPGCVSCQLLQSSDNAARFIVMAVWADRDAHERAVEAMPLDVLHRAMSLVAEMPRGGVWADRS